MRLKNGEMKEMSSKETILTELKEIIQNLDENEYGMGGYAHQLQQIHDDIDSLLVEVKKEKIVESWESLDHRMFYGSPKRPEPTILTIVDEKED